jgi:hypothetical protein
MTPMDHLALWQRTLGDLSDDFRPQREILRQAFLSFRDRTAQLVGEIGGLLPGLTVHDITHLDALWRVADEIAGRDYPLNPAEAFVLGGAFLLHDAAHVLVAYEDGLAGIKRNIEWKDLIAQRFDGHEPTTGSPQEHSALFQVLRHLHAKQARQLAKLSWKVPSTGEYMHLLEHFHLRDYYGDLVGEIAASHHWPAHRVASTFEDRHVNAPGFLAPAGWAVDALKVAFLLRTADAAHIDGQRAPWFLFALRHPEGISQLHWRFQAKMGQPLRTSRGELRLSSGSPFDLHDRQAWWLAYEVACMIDREIRDAQTLMRDTGRTPFAAASVEHVGSPEAFATNVRTAGWEPVNVAPKIGDVPKVITNLGGATLYGNRPVLALRELIQNAEDAVRALRTLGEIEQQEGEIAVALARDGDLTWLHVTDTGIGMSRYVLTEVLLDFGHSLWSRESLRTELPGLASQGFKAIGRFGIGFFSVFILSGSFPKLGGFFPDVGIAMRIPVHRSFQDRLDDLIDMLKAPPFQGEAAQWLPPGLNQVQPTGILREEQHRDLRPREQGDLRLPRQVRAQIVGNQAPLRRGIGLQHLLQELNEAGTVPARAAQRGGQPGRGLERTQHPHTPPAAIVGGEGRPTRATPPQDRSWRSRGPARRGR